MTMVSDHTPPSGNSIPAGSMPALVTPMQEDGKIDWQTYRDLIDWHIQSGTDAIVVTGSTGESATVSVDEHCELISAAVDHAKSRLPVIAGTGANSTSEAIELTRFAHTTPSAAALMLLGAQGNISVTANIIPTTMARLCAAARTGDVAAVRQISLRIAPLPAAMFVEANPIPVKWALAQMGRLSPFYRSPLTPLRSNRHEEVQSALWFALVAGASHPSDRVGDQA
jgi:dihydrodipicolinate synthase/N-acetylneuraminate lyase